MKNFAKFLIERGVLNHKQLVDICAYQEKCAVGLVEILRDEEMLEINKLSDLILESIEKGEHFYNLLHTYDKNLTQKAIDKSQNATPSFSSVLVQQDHLGAQELQDLYDEYQNSQAHSVENSSHEEEDENGGLSAAALESLRELGMDTAELESSNSKVEVEDHDLEYLNFFNQEKRDNILDLVTSVEHEILNGGDYQNLLNSLFKDFHLLKGAARLDDFKLSEKLIDQSEQLVCSIIESSAESADIFMNYKQAFNQAVSVIWDIRQNILEKEDEASFWKDENNKGRYMQLMKNLKYHSVAA